MTQIYDQIGEGYHNLRIPDPRIARNILHALGEVETLVNVGAGAGSYEPLDRQVVAVEPSLTMIRQRRPGIEVPYSGTSIRFCLVSSIIEWLSCKNSLEPPKPGVNYVSGIARRLVVEQEVSR